MGIREDRRNASLRTIGNAALELFFEQGFEHTKISDISEKADVSVGLIFHYFDSKESILNIILEQGIQKYIDIQDFLNKDDEEPLAKLEKLSSLLVKIFDGHVNTAKAFYLIETNTHILSNEVIESATQRIIEKTKELIISAQHRNEVRQGDPKLLALIFWRSFSIFSREYGLNPKIEIPSSDWFMKLIILQKGV